LAEALHQVMGNDSIRQKMATEAINNAKRFQLDGIAMRWKQLFEDVLS
jgi:hypothetical protein